MPQKKEDYITNKVMAVFTICLMGVLVLMGLRRLIDFGTTYLLGMMVLRVLMGVSALAVLLGVGLIMREKKQQTDVSLRIVNGRSIVTVFAVAFVIFALINRYGIPIFKVFYALLPVIAVYYLIYHSYQPEFCTIAADCGIAGALLLIVRRAQVSANVQYIAWVAVVVCAVLAAAQIAWVMQVKKNKGKVQFLGKKMSFAFSKNAYAIQIVTPILATVAVLLGAVLGINIALYAIFAVAGYLFVTMVYYTVKLM